MVKVSEHNTPKPSAGKSVAQTQGRQDPIVQKTGDEARELYIYPRVRVPVWKYERGIDPRPDIDTSGGRLLSPAAFNQSTAWAQPDFHFDARGKSYGFPEGVDMINRVAFSKRVHQLMQNAQRLPDAPEMCEVQRVGDERSKPATGYVYGDRQVWRRHQRTLSGWRKSRWQPVKSKMKGF